jgi:threonine/homoserine/homoserine lactone efflux protein
MTANARRNALWFLGGWVLGIIIVGGLVYIVPTLIPENSTTSENSLWIRFAIAIFLLIGAWHQYQSRPLRGEVAKVPRLLTRLDNVGIRQSMFTGFVLSGLNVKNVMFTGGGIIAMISAGVSQFALATAFFIFICIGSTLLILPVVLYYIFGSRAERFLIKARHWLSYHVQVVLALLLLAVSLILLYQSVPGLLMEG